MQPRSARTSVSVFAPATVANLGPGFDVLGVAVEGLGDTVIATRIDGEPGVELGEVTGDGGRLPRDPARNTATVAALRIVREAGVRVRLDVHKGLPLSSGLGSSASSAVAGAVAAAVVCGHTLDADRSWLLPATLDGEQAATGSRHADNVAPCLMGGGVVVHHPSADPPECVALPLPSSLRIVLAVPALELSTADARAALPAAISLGAAVGAWARVAGLVAACYRGDLDLLGRCLRDDIVEPVRGPLIPGFAAVRDAALQAGALASTISGAGPTLFAVTGSREVAKRVAAAMKAAWEAQGVACTTHLTRPDTHGARIL
jgi:homoserine kinase